MDYSKLAEKYSPELYKQGLASAKEVIMAVVELRRKFASSLAPTREMIQVLLDCERTMYGLIIESEAVLDRMAAAEKFVEDKITPLEPKDTQEQIDLDGLLNTLKNISPENSQ